ncbi:MAG TPA: EMC3/TMCO1 family protein [archaeon]|nr:EMC3/TMCO1 family protein [archaeon]
MPLISPIVDIALVSFAMAIVSQILQRKLIDRKKMKQSQEQMKAMQKQLKELAKQDNEKARQESARIQNEMLKSMNENMKGSMKHMVVSLPIFFVVFAVAGGLYGGQLVHLPFPLPVVHRDFSFEITATVSWLWWYIYCSLAFSIIFSIILKAVDKAKIKKEEKILEKK